jgi:uncharacterized membrane protein
VDKTRGVKLMFKLGSYLLFITFTQVIAVTLYLVSSFGDFAFQNIPGLVFIIILIEFIFSGYLIYIGYQTSPLKNMFLKEQKDKVD